MNTEDKLLSLRREIDAIDDQIHDLLMQRTEIVKGVRQVKKGQKIKIRPAREAEIIYRLFARHHGPFPKQELFRIWREIIVATLSFEGPFSVGVFMTGENCGYWDMARDQYGSFIPMNAYESARALVEAVQNQKAIVGILPLPTRGDPDPWWRRLMARGEDTPRVIARLPFVGSGNGRCQNMEALVICPVAQEATGRDRTILSFETEREIPLTRLENALRDTGLTPEITAGWQDPNAQGRGPWFMMADVEGFIAEDDVRIHDVNNILGDVFRDVIKLGGYATQLSSDEIANPPVDSA